MRTVINLFNEILNFLRASPFMGFMNALGSIKVSGNKILATASGLDIWVSTAPGLRAVGNPIRSDLGPNIPMPTP